MANSAGKLLVLQGGGPTPVLNASLFGVLDEARKIGRFDRMLGCRFGMEGLLREDWIDLSRMTQPDLDQLRLTPGATLGASRHKPSENDFERIIDNLRRQEVRALLLIGGNGSLRGADVIARAADRWGYDMSVIGIPKTVDNDIPSTDRCPGYGSAARYVAQSLRDLGMDVRALPQPVSIYETMGRGVGWLAAAAALAKLDEHSAPHLVYLPEKPFVMEQFLSALDRVVKRLGWAVIVVSEGIKNAEGNPVFEVHDATQRDALNRALTGGVGNYLSDVVTRELKIRCRYEKPGLCGRASILHVSSQDLADAELVGRAGVRGAIEGRHAHAVALRPLDASKFDPAYDFISLASAAGERAVPNQWLADPEAGGVTSAFVRYARPIVGELLPYAIPLSDHG
ncbi:MAG TPA: diphosphate--fructose-6-phosphate 1-phosphotransferase [Tepidisphaeraceae bacterium]|jgi:6-phosphofructokinase|nr:diphosphate--fructose-6-phosphate 1-phosphotransferase [Tepidisphaeraceae bacterium]